MVEHPLPLDEAITLTVSGPQPETGNEYILNAGRREDNLYCGIHAGTEQECERLIAVILGDLSMQREICGRFRNATSEPAPVQRKRTFTRLTMWMQRHFGEHR